ncbi:hypothetical protein Hanom_Chr04g00374501 [Helianthus anomalus]
MSCWLPPLGTRRLNRTIAPAVDHTGCDQCRNCDAAIGHGGSSEYWWWFCPWTTLSSLKKISFFWCQ